jgi:pyruvate carboxylase
VLKGKATIEGRPGASLAPLNMDSLEYRLKEKYGNRAISKRDVLSAALYPKVGVGGCGWTGGWGGGCGGWGCGCGG